MEHTTQEAMQSFPITTAEPVVHTQTTSPLRYSGFWVRWAAAILDGWIVGAIVSVATMPIGFAIGFFSAAVGEGHVGFSISSMIFTVVVSAGIGFAYYIFMTHRYGATLGKMAVGARVCAEDGSPLPLRDIALRETVGKMISGFVLNIGYLMAAFTTRKRALHDMLVHSVVVYKDPVKGPRKAVVGAVFGVFVLFMMAIFALFGAALFMYGMQHDVMSEMQLPESLQESMEGAMEDAMEEGMMLPEGMEGLPSVDVPLQTGNTTPSVN